MRNLAPTAPVIRYHGGKFRLAPWILKHMPQHRVYVEPFGGGGSVLMAKPRAYAEVYNDLDGNMVNLFRVLRCPRRRALLVEQLALTPYARAEFALALKPSRNTVEQARRTIVLAQMGFGSAGATKGTTGFRIDTDREYSTAQHMWVRYPPTLAVVGERLQGVLIENRPAIDVMRAHDGSDVLHYVDPPYLPETRCSRGHQYRHEMTIGDHADLLAAVQELRGMVMISGYPSALYTESLSGWHRLATSAWASGQRGAVKRTEVLWLNSAASRAMTQQSLFADPVACNG